MTKQEPIYDCSGVPHCQKHCPSYDGKRCEILGHTPSDLCLPAVQQMATSARNMSRALLDITEAADARDCPPHQLCDEILRICDQALGVPGRNKKSSPPADNRTNTSGDLGEPKVNFGEMYKSGPSGLVRLEPKSIVSGFIPELNRFVSECLSCGCLVVNRTICLRCVGDYDGLKQAEQAKKAESD